MSTQSSSIVPPTTGNSFTAFSQNISRNTTSSFQPSASWRPSTTLKISTHLVDGMPPAPPPSPVSFAIDSNSGQFIDQWDEIHRLSLEG
ncbi:hypothetical protein N7539_008058 [Penicillium diatomitis]|uniref:Uncharacterized protein n=1 Tax=Penicillium diatomitis TaxID=2819901 RepID=A0A9W9WT27_9EURO|nr:uncharacterized protein N7539_008058 [Penicillium diatomitis]KAJ5474992.1 hypothetical protein N7539_008058 [Penicillium diatomitis]